MKENNKNHTKIFLGLIGIIIAMAVISIVILLITNWQDKGVGSAGISTSEFKEIEIGMSNFSVNNVIDKNDEWNNDEIYKKCCEEIRKSKNGHIYEYTYKYYGEKGGYATVTYEADYSQGDLFVLPKVIKKEQFNLK